MRQRRMRKVRLSSQICVLSRQDHKMASPEQVLELAGHILDGCDKDNKAKAPSSRNCDKTTRQDQNAGQADNCDNNVARGTPATATPRSNGFAHERPGHRRFERTASLHSSHKKTVGGAGRQADYSREKVTAGLLRYSSAKSSDVGYSDKSTTCQNIPVTLARWWFTAAPASAARAASWRS